MEGQKETTSPVAVAVAVAVAAVEGGHEPNPKIEKETTVTEEGKVVHHLVDETAAKESKDKVVVVEDKGEVSSTDDASKTKEQGAVVCPIGEPPSGTIVSR